ncbi:sialoadhesin-like [Chaetodon auriga]|uniref:sialoadhesin-like n=1 Tax=Chaetodon auriga TaxID=39042 RepID=UPI004032C11C
MCLACTKQGEKHPMRWGMVQGQRDWGVTYDSTEICALKGSTVEIRCTYTYPSSRNRLYTRVQNKFWFTKLSRAEHVDLRTDSQYSGRVDYRCNNSDCTLRITDLRESDSAEYKFRFTTNQPDGSYTGSPGVTLTVTDLQVKEQGSNSGWIYCHSVCYRPDYPSYIWYRNGEKIQGKTSSSYYYSSSHNSADSFSCALSGHEDFPSPSVCVRGETCNKVTYTHRNICAFKGSSVDISCTYSSHSDDVTSKFWFSPDRSHQWQNSSQPEDLREDSQYAGRVQVLETEGGRSTLRITDLTESDSAQYHFKFRVGSFEWRSSLPGTTLTVIALQVQVTRIKVYKFYTQAELKCHSSSRPAGQVSYIWVKNGQKITWVQISSYKGFFYPNDIISCALKGHETCVSPSVYAPKPPSVSVSPSGDIVEGSSVTLTCSSDANPAANYTWYKENVNVKALSEEAQFVFSSIQSSDSGEYYCAAENELWRRTSKHISIDVKYFAPKLPSVSVSPSGEIVEGSSVTLSCSSDANPAANYTWYKENEDTSKASGQNFTITDFRAEHSGNYYCEAQNKIGRHNSTMYLLVVTEAMSSTAAVSGFVVFLLSVQVVQGQRGWGVTYGSTKTCALKGSTVEIRCTYTYPSSGNRPYTEVQNKFWFTELSRAEPVDLRTDSQYSGRVEYSYNNNDCTLRITDLRESDSAKYKFRFTTNQPDGSYTGSPGVTLNVTDLQVKEHGSNSGWIYCQRVCYLPDRSSYIWYRNGEKIQRESSSSSYYYSRSHKPADSYSCALSGHEDFPSPSVCVRGETCNKVTYTHRNICAFKGSSADISCTYSSHSDDVTSEFWFSPDRSHQWKNTSQPEDLREDSQYAGRVQVLETEGGRSTLRITDLTESDSAQYHFKFRAGSFEWRSSLPGTTLTVIALQVQVTRIKVHQSYTQAELKCHSSCHPAGQVSYIWFKNGEEITRTQISSYKGWFYLGDIISCALKGHETCVSPSVYAPKPPSVSVSPSGDIVEGSSVNLSCSSDANPAANYTWYKENVNVKALSEEAQFVFRSIQSSDSGEYYCAAENELGRRTSEHISINVKYAPKLPSVSVSPSGDIVEGSSVTLSCNSDANPAANYTWYKENQTLTSQGIYGFTSVSIEDSGMYHCTSENKYGKTTSTSIRVDVQYAPKPPSVSVSPSGEIVEGSSVTLSCSSDANPAANYTWYKENEVSPTASGQNFTITDFRAEHSGNYYCEAQNKIGHHNSTIYLPVVPGSMKSVAAGTFSVVFLAIIFLCAFLFIRKKRTLKQTTERPDNKAQVRKKSSGDQDELFYASINFSANQEDSLYSNIRQAQPNRHMEEKDEDTVEYTAVHFKSASVSPESRRQDAAEDSSALYSTVAKKPRVYEHNPDM